MEVVGRKMNGAAIGEIPAPITSFLPPSHRSCPHHVIPAKAGISRPAFDDVSMGIP